MDEFFRRLASRVSVIAGTWQVFAGAVLICLVWLCTGPVFGYSNTWSLMINTITTIITFLMVFLIQSSQNRDTRATLLKLDELIRSIDKARDEFIRIEDAPKEEIDEASKEVGNHRETKP